MPSSLFGGPARVATPATASSQAPGINLQLMQAAQSIKRMMGTLRTVQDPMAAIMQAAQQDPQLGAVVQMCQGRNPQDVFVEECQKNGVDPNAAMRQIQQLFS